MERNLGKGPMDQQRSYEQVRYSNVDSRNEGLGSTNQRFIQDPSSNINTNIRPPDYNMSVGTRPVLNYSIQTGEEFEFMRERVNSRQHFIPNAYGDPNSASTYMDLTGILGSSHTGSESTSDISMLNAVEKTHALDFERKGSSAQEEKSYHDSVRSGPQTSSRNDISRGLHSYPSSGRSHSSSTKVKFLCSFGGKILPRPSDGRLRHVGGETRIIQISKDISWQELMQKTLTIYSQTVTIKYQLPGEDLDALVSVSCDEDVQNMMEELNVLQDGGSHRPRIFLFSSGDLEDVQRGLGSMEGDSEMQYVVAVNGIDFGSKKNSFALASTSGNNLDELLALNVEREPPSSELAGVSIAPSTVNVPSSTHQASQSVLPGSASSYESKSQAYQGVTYESNSHAYPGVAYESNSQAYKGVTYESNSQAYQGVTTHQVEAVHHPASNFHPMESYAGKDGKTTVPLSVPLQYSYSSHHSNFATSGESFAPMPIHGYPIHQGVLAEEQLYGGYHIHDSEVSTKETKMKKDSSFPKIHEKVRSLEKEGPLKEAVMKRESSLQKINDTDKNWSRENELSVSSYPHDGSAPNYIPKEEPSLVNSAADVGPPSIVVKSKQNLQEPALNPVHSENVIEGKKNNGDDQFYASGGPFGPGYGGSEADPADFSSFEPPMVPQPVFSSERIPREQAELNRLSKSDNSFNSQFIITQALSDHSHPITNSVDKLHGENVALHSEQPVLSSKAPPKNSQNFEGLVRSENISKMNSKISEEVLDSKLQKSELRVVNSGEDREMGQFKDSLRDLPVDENHQLSSQGPAKHKESSGSSSPKFDWRENTTDKDIFLKARTSENFSGINPLSGDGTGVSFNMENHEPKSWSYFRKLAQDEFERKDVSLMDQDHLGYSALLKNIGEAPVDYSYPPLKSDGVALGHLDSRVNFGEDIHQESANITGPISMTLPSGYNPSQLNDKESDQLDVVNHRIPESDYEDGKLNIQNTGAPLVDLTLEDFDISTLQIIKNEDLEELRELGSGTFGTVYHGKWRGTDVAIKRIKKSCFTGRSSEQERLTVEFWREAEILSKLHHPNVVAFYGVVQDGPGGTLATVTEFMVNGSLRHVLLSKERQLDRRKRLIIAMDAAFGMEYLHSKNIVHFDLKCDNLLVNLKDPLRPICKVGDFGLSKIKRNTLVTGGVRGTLPWMAPELLNGSSSKVSEKVDVFSFGIVLWEILTGEEPYANMHYGAIIGGIVNNTLRPLVPSYCDPEWRLLMEQCWAPDPVGRPSFTEIARRLRVMSAACQPKPPGHQPQNQVPK
ncbi:hypothetical protein UlMin_019128 [Ulmus minor]